MQIDQAKRYRELEQDNQPLRKVIADLTIDKTIVKNPPGEISKTSNEDPIQYAGATDASLFLGEPSC